MAAITPLTQQKIKGYLEAFIENLLVAYETQSAPSAEPRKTRLEQISKEGRLKPFHSAMIPPEFVRLNAFERSFSTRLGSTFEECARLIAADHHALADRGYKLKAEVSLSALNEIERQVEQFEHAAQKGIPRPAFQQMIQSVLDARNTTDLIHRELTIDLYVKTKTGIQYFFEIKSPLPNKGQCLEVTQRLLRAHLFTAQNRPKTQAYFAMAYNPYGQGKDNYRWTYPRNYMPFEQAVWIGKEFWTFIGGDSTFEELLNLYDRVGQEKAKRILDVMAHGF